MFDIGLVEDSWAGYTNPIRLIVVRTPHNPKRGYRIGKRIGDFIYELFITSLAQAGLTGTDILSLYYSRGGFEKQLGMKIKMGIAFNQAEEDSSRNVAGDLAKVGWLLAKS